MLTLARSILSSLPLSVSLGGRKRKVIAKTFDALFNSGGTRRIRTKYGDLVLNMDHEPERLLGYCFTNIMRHYEASPLGRHIVARAPLGGSFIDVGANLGVYSLIAKTEGLEAYLVEPEPQHAAFLKRNAAILGVILPVALSDVETTMPLYYNPANSGATSLVPPAGQLTYENVVEVTTFSSLSEKGDLGDSSRINLIKIDVEGFEASMVRGMGRFLESGQTPDIWCEVRGDVGNRARGSFREVSSFLSRFGYEAFDGEAQEPVRTSLTEAEMAARQVFDLLFTTKPRPQP